MPLPRPLLQLCALLLIVFAATAAHAAAPPYDLNEVQISIGATPNFRTRSDQNKNCAVEGGVLLPMVTDAVYQQTTTQMDSLNIKSAMGYMGGSTTLSPSNCNTSKTSLDCIWRWDEGRYAGAENAIAFYEGNRHPDGLYGARMVGNLVKNYWRTGENGNEKYPGVYMQRYGMAVRNWAALGWADSSDSTWTYSQLVTAAYHTFCAVDLITTVAPTPSTTTTTKPSAGLSVGAIVGIAAGGAVAVGLIIALVVCLACNGCCCSAGSTAVADTASQWGDMSRANSFRPRHSGYGDVGNRSFHNGAWLNDCEMTSVAGSRCSRAASPVMVPLQTYMVMQLQPAMPMRGKGQPVEAPMPVSVYTTEESSAEMQRRCSNVNPVMCDMSDTDDVHAVAAVSV